MESAQGWGLCWPVTSWGQETREVRKEQLSKGLGQWRGEAVLVDYRRLQGQRRAEGPVATRSVGGREGGTEGGKEGEVVNTEERGDRIRECHTMKPRCWT